MTAILALLAKQTFALLFFVVAAGYALGRCKIRGIGLGATASTIIIGIGVSVLAAHRGVAIAIPDFAGAMFFNLFMFAVGMKVGPQFLAGLRRDARRFISIGLFIPFAAILLMLAMRGLFDLGPGMSPGVFAGADTATPGLGAAQAAYAGRLNVAGVPTADVLANMSTGFAFSYCVSTILFVFFTKLPELLGSGLAGPAREYEATILGASDAALPGTGGELFGQTLPVAVRSFEIDAPNVVGHRLDELRTRHPHIAVERVLRAGTVLEPRDDLVLQLRDTVALFGEIPLLVAAGPRIGPEVDDRTARDVGSQTVDIVVGKRSDGKTLEELASGVGHGLYLNAMFRAGEAIPSGPATVVRKGDVLRVTGSNYRIKLLQQLGGTLVAPSLSTDIATLAFGVGLGALLGIITIPVGHLRLQVGSAVGLLVVGIVLSILRTRYPGLGGPFPEPARRLFEDLGLNVFVAVLGLNAGAAVLGAIAQGALGPMLAICLIVGFVPPMLAWLIWGRLLGMNRALLLGAIAGGRCNSAGMQAAQEATHSSVPAISYPATFAIANIVFTIATYILALAD